MHLFLPILETFLPLSIALLAMEEEKANKGSSHSSKDAHGNKNIYIDAKMVRFSSGLATDTRDKAIPRFTFLVSGAGFTKGLFLQANLLCRIAVESKDTVAP